MTDKIAGARRYLSIISALLKHAQPNPDILHAEFATFNAIMAQNPVDEAEAIAIYDALDGARKGGAK